MTDTGGQAINLAKKIYRPAKQADWAGRPSQPGEDGAYWHQAVSLLDIYGLRATPKERLPKFGLVGYACDEGVGRNRGRIGAKAGPRALRRRLAKLAWHGDAAMVADFGDIDGTRHTMEDCQDALATIVGQLLAHNITPMVVGGGHDMAYGHFMGLWQALQNRRKVKIGIVNFDAHFDLRPVENQPNSGTPFNQVLASYSANVSYLAIGIQQPSNTKHLFAIAKENGVGYIPSEACETNNFEAVAKQLASFVGHHDYLYVTIDLDGFSSAYAPGVSAPSPMGFSPGFVRKTLQWLSGTNKVACWDIAELNPAYDRDGATANLAARLVDFIICQT